MSGVVQGLARAAGGVLPRIAGGLLSVPVTTAFVLLGLAVVLGRGLRRLMTHAVPSRSVTVAAAPRGSAG